MPFRFRTHGGNLLTGEEARSRRGEEAESAKADGPEIRGRFLNPRPYPLTPNPRVRAPSE